MEDSPISPATLNLHPRLFGAGIRSTDLGVDCPAIQKGTHSPQRPHSYHELILVLTTTCHVLVNFVDVHLSNAISTRVVSAANLLMPVLKCSRGRVMCRLPVSK